MSAELVVRGRRVVLPDGVRPAAVHIEAGRIAAVTEPDHIDAAGAAVLEADDLLVLPGLVDSHVHVNEPGRTDWEGFDTATRAAAAGGTTTIVDMPLNSIPPTVTVDALRAKQDAARGRCHVDVAFWGGLVPDSDPHVDGLAAAGVCGFKAFLVDSGVPEFPAVDAELLDRVLPALARLERPLLVHAELPGPLAEPLEVFARRPPAERRRYATYLASRPPTAEDEAVRLVAEASARTDARVHIVHVAAGSALEPIRRARAAGTAITAETCPHYLTVAAEDIPDGATAYKCAPPIREAAHRDALWQGLAAGTIDMVVSDHSPAPATMKSTASGDFGAAWGGISSLQLRLPLTWTEARHRGFGFDALAGWLAHAPARLVGLADRKGAIAPGRPADLVLFDPDAEFVVEPERLEHRHPVSPYGGVRLRGRVEVTVLRGRIVYQDGRLVETAAGTLLERR
ncbi:MAG: allantoinase AllB [Acidimicrobiales bacterium]